MKNSYLLEVIQVLKPEEREEITQFLRSSFFNNGTWKKEVEALYQLILDAAPDFSPENLSKERVGQVIFSDKKVVSGKMEKLMSELNRLVRLYALWGRYVAPKNEQQQQIEWASWLRERGLGSRHQQVMAKAKNKAISSEYESLEKYRIALKIAEEEHEWESENNQFKNDLNLADLVYRLDAYYFNYRTELINRFLLQQKAASLPPFEWMTTDWEMHRQTSLLLDMAQKVQDFLQKEIPTVEEFRHLLELLRQHEQVFSFQIVSQLYAYLRGFCSTLINDGHLDLIPTLHLLHQENLVAGYLSVDGKIPVTAYLNLVQIALRAGDVAWAKTFTQNYRDKLFGGDDIEMFYQLNLANCLFASGDFEEAVNQIPSIPSASHYHMLARLLEIKIYYELESDLLHYKIFAFRKYIERTAPKSLSAKLRKMNLHFLNLLLQICQSPAHDKKRSERLVLRIHEKPLVSERAWLLEKARALG